MNNRINIQIVEEFFKALRLVKQRKIFNSPMSHLTFVQIQTLRFLKEKKKAQINEIASYFSTAMSTTTELLDKLTNLGLVQKEEDSKDRRIVHAILTKKGSSLLYGAQRKRQEHFDRLLLKLSQRDKVDLVRIIRKISS